LYSLPKLYYLSYTSCILIVIDLDLKLYNDSLRIVKLTDIMMAKTLSAETLTDPHVADLTVNVPLLILFLKDCKNLMVTINCPVTTYEEVNCENIVKCTCSE
jgi:hypothetical protein